jgi:hypothetical protein
LEASLAQDFHSFFEKYELSFYLWSLSHQSMKAVTILQPPYPTVKNITALKLSNRILPDRNFYEAAVEADVKLSNKIFVSDFFVREVESVQGTINVF